VSDTRTKILNVAERLTQTRGFNGFSYLDLAEEVGIKNSSIHYHFKAKSDLAVALIERTHAGLLTGLSELDASEDKPEKRLKAVISSFQTYIKDGKFCLCGMLSAELQSVSAAARKRLIEYFSDFQIWLKNQFKAIGHSDAKDRALQFVSALEGAILIARLQNNPAIISKALLPIVKN